MFPQFEADESKAYIEFDICHTLPAVAGPVQLGNFIGYFPSTLEASHASLVHQQFNLRHMLKFYGSEKQPIHKDRIIGCIVASKVPRKPFKGWREPGKPEGETSQMHCCAVVFKLADGVGRMLGDHLTTKRTQSVSIEVTTHLGNIGLYRPSTDELHSVLEPPDEWLTALRLVKGTAMPAVGELQGERLIVVYGMGEPVHFRGVGATDRPAERAAKITSVTAEEGFQQYAIAAEEVPSVLVGRKIQFRTGREGVVERVEFEGKVKAEGVGFTLKASAEEPVAVVRFANGDRILRRVNSLVER